MGAGGRLQGGTDMAKKRNAGRKEPKLQDEKALSRREFFKGGAAAGVGAAVLSGTGEAQAHSPSVALWHQDERE